MAKKRKKTPASKQQPKQQSKKGWDFCPKKIAFWVVIAAVVFTVITKLSGGGTMAEVAVFETNMGTIEIELDRENAPITVENFVQYVNNGHYDGTIFHRVISNFMIQGGGFTPDASQKETRAPIKLESQNGLKNVKGTVAMARTNVPDSATAQFFINTVDNNFLDNSPGNDGYAVFGKVVAGMDAVEKIRGVTTSNKGPHQDWPIEDVVITKAYMK